MSPRQLELFNNCYNILEHSNISNKIFCLGLIFPGNSYYYALKRGFTIIKNWCLCEKIGVNCENHVGDWMGRICSCWFEWVVYRPTYNSYQKVQNVLKSNNNYCSWINQGKFYKITKIKPRTVSAIWFNSRGFFSIKILNFTTDLTFSRVC